MARTIKDESARKNLRRARKTEKHKLLDEKQLDELNKESFSIYEKLRKLLKSAWFVRDTDQPRRRK